jgi:uncharacterized membrane protein YdjX (TVP38/TMEM64 family)
VGVALGNPPDAPQDEPVRSPSSWLRPAALGVLLALAAVLALTLDLPTVETVRGWIDGAGPLGWVGMVVGLAVLLLGPVPRSVVSVLVGLVAGFWSGLAISLIGGLLSALAAFALSRALGRPTVTRFGARRLAHLDRLAVDRGFLAVLTGRLLPVMPFVVVSYGAGLTAVRWAPYALATAVGLVPSTVVQVGVGASAPLLGEWASTWALVPLVVVLAVVAGGVLLWGWRRGTTSASSAPTEPVAVPVA